MCNFATALKQLKEQALFRFVERFRFNAIADEGKGEADVLLAAEASILRSCASDSMKPASQTCAFQKSFNRANPMR